MSSTPAHCDLAGTISAINSNTASTVGSVTSNGANTVAGINSNGASTAGAVNSISTNTTANNVSASSNNAANTVAAVNNNTANTAAAVDGASASNTASTVDSINNSTANTVGAINNTSTSNAANTVAAVNNDTASTVAAVDGASAANTANTVNSINNSTANTAGSINNASISSTGSAVGAVDNSTSSTVSAVNNASATNVAAIAGSVSGSTAITVGAINNATAASTDSIVAAITASTLSTVGALNSASAASAASVVGAINNSTASSVAAVNSSTASSVATNLNTSVIALAPAVSSAANSAAIDLQGSLYNATNSGISAVFQQGSSSVTNLTIAAENFVASAGSALANGQQAAINITQVGSVVGSTAASAIETTVRNGLNGFAESCIYSLLALQHSRGLNFSNQAGVSTTIREFGNTTCAPTPYAPLYSVLQGVGYQPGKDLFVACYDWRTSPNVDVGADGIHLQNAQRLVEMAYNNTNGTKVYLHAHSNGAIYALSLLNSTLAAWRQKYIAGFIPVAGNWIGHGLTYSYLLSGQSVLTGAPYPGSARAFASWPSTYLSASFPSQYNQSETIIINQGTGNYTPAQASAFYADANIPYASDLAPLFQGNMTPSNTSPGTHFYGFYGTGIPTLVGQTYTNLTSAGNLILNSLNITLNGDGRQENLGNFVALAFNKTLSPCYHFELLEVLGIPHLLLPMNPNVLQILTSILYKEPPSVPCALAPSQSASVIPSRSG
ncbi:hypothetical protein WJX74_002433 [Apatococcus lobatus]|uniref:Uncharacterized protein n=1 Tax=Apatococcus lobatus TaxID=904363 RepID=A0AAW1R3B0_9CHLO